MSLHPLSLRGDPAVQRGQMMYIAIEIEFATQCSAEKAKLSRFSIHSPSPFPTVSRLTKIKMQGLGGRARQLTMKLNKIEDRLIGVQSRVAILPGVDSARFPMREQLRLFVD